MNLPPPPRRRCSGGRLARSGALLLTVVFVTVTPPALFLALVDLAYSQGGPDPEADIIITATALSNSSGSAQATNQSAIWHYQGELRCVTTCPGPEPDGCSNSASVVKAAELAPGGAVGCLMPSQVSDVCCTDDGDFFIGAKFKATFYRASASDPWTPLPIRRSVTVSDLNEDAHSNTHQPNPNRPTDKGHIQLNVSCEPPPGTANEALAFVHNGSQQHIYQIEARAQAVCPSDLPGPCCVCRRCSAGPCPQATIDPNCAPGAFGAFLNDTTTPYPKTHAGKEGTPASNDAIWLPDDKFLPGEDFPLRTTLSRLNECCDSPTVGNVIVCGEVNTLRVQKPKDCPTCFSAVNSPAFDKVNKQACGDNPLGKDHVCFSDLTAFCQSPP